MTEERLTDEELAKLARLAVECHTSVGADESLRYYARKHMGALVAELCEARADNVALTARVKQLESALAASPLPDLLDSVADLLADLHEVAAASRLQGQAAMLRLACKGDGSRE